MEQSGTSIFAYRTYGTKKRFYLKILLTFCPFVLLPLLVLSPTTFRQVTGKHGGLLVTTPTRAESSVTI
jgi:hypothetical protein